MNKFGVDLRRGMNTELKMISRESSAADGFVIKVIYRTGTSLGKSKNPPVRHFLLFKSTLVLI